jgi:hypothetical protein
MEQDPAGYVDGLNLYEFVGSSPTNYTDPLGLEKAADISGDFTLWDADRNDNLFDPQGTLHLELSATNQPKANEMLKLQLKAAFKISGAMDTSDLGKGALYVNGKKVTVTSANGKKGSSSEFAASWQGEAKVDANCHAEGSVYVALWWKDAVKSDDDLEKNEKPNSGVAQSYLIKWRYDAGKGLRGDIKEYTSRHRNLPRDGMPPELDDPEFNL